MATDCLGFPRRTSDLAASGLAAPDETDLALWLSADTGVEVGVSNDVIYWRDPRGNGRVASQVSNASQRPTLVAGAVDARAAIRFSGLQQLVLGTGIVTTTDYTFFAVATRSASTAGAIVGDIGTTAGGSWHVKWDSNTSFRLGHYYADLVLAVRPYLSGQWTCVTCVMQRGYGRLIESLGARLAFTADAAPMASGNADLRIGNHTNTAFLTGDIAEILIYTRALTPKQRRAVEAYLVARYPSVIPFHHTGW